MPGVPASGYAAMPQVAGCVTAPTRNALKVPPRLHPLHTAEWLHMQVISSGRYPDTERMTGRTTLLALQFIAEALSKPHEVIEVRDHHPTTNSHTMLVKLIHDMTTKLGLKGFLCNPSRLTIQFTVTISAPTPY